LDKLLEFHLLEWREQVEAIKQGLADIIPHDLLSILSWQEIQLQVLHFPSPTVSPSTPLTPQVCGAATLDLEMLKSSTEYEDGISADDQHVNYFWAALLDFTHEQHSQFLRFVYARSKLPATGPEMKFKLKVSPQIRQFKVLFSFFPFFRFHR
jgi:E3 ubiquitin-protein ligase HECTD3